MCGTCSSFAWSIYSTEDSDTQHNPEGQIYVKNKVYFYQIAQYTSGMMICSLREERDFRADRMDYLIYK